MANLDEITRENTAFKSFQEMLDAYGGYRPSLHCKTEVGDSAKKCQTKRKLRRLADEYDSAQQERGDSRRAYRF